MSFNNSAVKDSNYVATKGVISRRNQDGTIILMRLNDAQYFYKITGLAAAVWSELETPKSTSSLVSYFGSLFPEQKETIDSEIPKFIAQLRAKDLLSTADAEAGPMRSESHLSESLKAKFTFGGVAEFDLEKIETEVLNESVYLDVFAGSDLKLKQDIKPIEGAMSKLNQLNGIIYKWNSATVPHGDAFNHAGLIAQEVAAVMPELVRRDEKTGMLAVEYSKLNAYLVEAVKDLNQVIIAQEERIQKLEERLLSQLN